MQGFLNALNFATPLALLGLLALPLIWWLLRFTPPRPKRINFPPLRILLGLPSQEETPDKTPLWLLLLRLALAALLVIGVSQPFLQARKGAPIGAGQRLVIVDNGWAAAANWPLQREKLLATLEEARRAGSNVTLLATVPGTQGLPEGETAARTAEEAARLWKPSPQAADRMALAAALKANPPKEVAAVHWLSDGLDHGSAPAFASALKAQFPNAVLQVEAPPRGQLPLALSAFQVDGNDIKVSALRATASGTASATINVQATNGRTLLQVPVQFGAAAERAVSFSLPTALRNNVQSLSIEGQAHAGARQLFDDRWRKRIVALQSGDESSDAQLLLSPLHYLRRGLEPFAELYEPASSEELRAFIDSGLSMLVLADVATLPDADVQTLTQWIDRGGILVRFAGPRLAAQHDALLPVPLREGDRTLGSALSWDAPQPMQDFPQNSPFAGLKLDPTVKIGRQVLAEPGPALAESTWASLADGTPLVTAQKRGKGLIVLFHVTANASWSNLPLSGLFLEMMQRVAGLDPLATTATPTAGDAAFVPRLLLTGEGDLAPPDGSTQSISPADMPKATPSAKTPAGIYVRQGKEQALNFSLMAADLLPMPQTVAGVAVETTIQQERRNLAPFVFVLAALLFLLDSLAAIMLGGGFRRAAAAAAVLLALGSITPLQTSTPAYAQQAGAAASTPDDAAVPEADIEAAINTRLAYVKTGNPELDSVSAEGLKGLSQILSDRTSTTLAEPAAIDMERDEIIFYPLIYWPVDENAATPSDAVRAKLKAYMKSGGTIFFDTRDGGVDTSGETRGNAALKRLLAGLDVPPLEPVPDTHVLTKSFYLLSDFPGRYEGPRPWVEASAGASPDDPGTADGVSSIIVGSNDYAAAWALNDAGEGLYPLVPGADRQREFAFRTGINLVMYALTGNYKADQVHIPALLERLGQ